MSKYLKKRKLFQIDLASSWIVLFLAIVDRGKGQATSDAEPPTVPHPLGHTHCCRPVDIAIACGSNENKFPPT